MSLDTNDSSVKTFKDFGCQVTSKDPLNLRLGASVTSDDFFTAALELEKKPKKKEAKELAHVTARAAAHFPMPPPPPPCHGGTAGTGDTSDTSANHPRT